MATAQEYLDNFLKPEETTAEEALVYVIQVCQDLNLPFVLQFDPEEISPPEAENPGMLLVVQGYRFFIDGESYSDENGGDLVYPEFELMVINALNLLQSVLIARSALEESGSGDFS